MSVTRSQLIMINICESSVVVIVAHKLGSRTSVKKLADASGKWDFDLNLLLLSIKLCFTAINLPLSPNPYRSFTIITMWKRYIKPQSHMLSNSMAFADVGDSDAAASLELFELLHWHGQRQLDAPSNP